MVPTVIRDTCATCDAVVIMAPVEVTVVYHRGDETLDRYQWQHEECGTLNVKPYTEAITLTLAPLFDEGKIRATFRDRELDDVARLSTTPITEYECIRFARGLDRAITP